ncbi:MAG TPA: DUF547 domain-containing protein [Vicinamibacterales bacterium]|nr:DUF547 domain-containing protein [Vicinamibacterales bacterium]
MRPGRILPLIFAAIVCITAPAPQAQVAGLHRPLDEILDLYVRDGLVYYGALRAERRRLDAYLASLERVPAATVTAWSPEAQIAFWLNAYNGLVLRTVIDRYPIAGRSTEYPRNSIRQIPGVFNRIQHRVAGRALTLDQIELEMLAPFGDPRTVLALGRGSVGGGRLRSEAFTAERLESQLEQVAAELPTRHELLRVDVDAGEISVTPLFSWREALFTRAYADKADARFAQRSPIERAVVALILPHLLPTERTFVMANTFRLRYHDYDWRLNDMNGGAPK